MLDGASPELASLRRQQDTRRGRLLEKLDKYRSPAAEAGAFVTQRNERFVVAVRADRFDRARGVVHDVSRTGAMLFVEPFAVLALNNELRELAAAEEEEEERVLDALSREVEAHADDLEAGSAALAELDLLAARVRLSAAVGGNTPEVGAGADARFDLRRARHPLLWRRRRARATRGGRRRRWCPSTWCWPRRGGCCWSAGRTWAGRPSC